jgi:hypothetical protein
MEAGVGMEGGARISVDFVGEGFRRYGRMGRKCSTRRYGPYMGQSCDVVDKVRIAIMSTSFQILLIERFKYRIFNK